MAFKTTGLELEEHTIPTSFRTFMMAQIDQGVEDRMVSAGRRMYALNDLEKIGPTLSVDQLTEQFGGKWKEPTTAMAAQHITDENNDRAKRESIIDGYDGFGDTVGGFAIRSISTILDPVDIALGAIAGAGAGKVASKFAFQGIKKFGTTLTAETIANATAEAPVLLATKQEQRDYTAEQFLANVVGGTLAFTGGTHALGHLMGKFAKYAHSRRGSVEGSNLESTGLNNAKNDIINQTDTAIRAGKSFEGVIDNATRFYKELDDYVNPDITKHVDTELISNLRRQESEIKSRLELDGTPKQAKNLRRKLAKVRRAIQAENFRATSAARAAIDANYQGKPYTPETSARESTLSTEHIAGINAREADLRTELSAERARQEKFAEMQPEEVGEVALQEARVEHDEIVSELLEVRKKKRKAKGSELEGWKNIEAPLVNKLRAVKRRMNADPAKAGQRYLKDSKKKMKSLQDEGLEITVSRNNEYLRVEEIGMARQRYNVGEMQAKTKEGLKHDEADYGYDPGAEEIAKEASRRVAETNEAYASRLEQETAELYEALENADMKNNPDYKKMRKENAREAVEVEIRDLLSECYLRGGL